jgi:sialic acid synthase SpsE
MENETQTVVLQRRALRAARPIAKGTKIAPADLIPLRPCPPGALPPHQIDELLGRTAALDIPEGECVRIGDVQ